MAKALSVEDIKDLDDGDVVARFEGTITEFKTWKTKIGKEGDGTLQIFLMEDDDGDEISVKAWDHERIPEKWRGEKVTVLAHKGKSGLTGVFACDDEFNDKTSRILRLTSSAEVVRGGSAKEGEPDSDEDRSRKRKSDDDDRGERKSSRLEKDPEDAIDTTKGRITQLCNLYALCYQAGSKIGQKLVDATNVEMSPDQFQGMVGSIFISCDRGGYGDALPDDEFVVLSKAKPSNKEEDDDKRKSRKSDD